MKKLLVYILVFILGAGIGIGGCMWLFKPSEAPAPKPEPISSLTDASTQTDNNVAAANSVDDLPNEVLLSLAYRAASYIKDGDYQKLSEMVHPEYGCVFSPYSTVILSANKCFTASQIAGFGSDTTKYVWGTYDGSGNPIEFTPAQYFAEFVFNADYTQAPVVGINHIIKTGNSLENIDEVFPNAQYVELHYPQFDPAYSGMDWCTLRLVFENYNGSLYLTAIIHSQWTI